MTILNARAPGSVSIPVTAPDHIRSLSPYVPGKPIEETRRELGLERVIKLASNENPLGPSPKAIAALQAAVGELHRYPDGAAYHLKRAVAAREVAQASEVLIGNGSNELIDLLVRTFCVAGDAIVTSRAAFIAYRICAQLHGVRTIETAIGDDLRFDLGAILEAVRADSRAKLVFIANPNNPTGTHVSREALTAFLSEISLVRGGSVLVVLDSAYGEYVTAPELPDGTELWKRFPAGVVVLKTFSKVYGLAGLRVGYAVAHEEVLAQLEKVRMPFNVNSLALVAAEAALGDSEFISRSVRLNTEGLAFWRQGLESLGVAFWPSQGNFLLADVAGRFGRDGATIYQECLKKGVIFRPVANYGLPRALRISVGTPEENQLGFDALRSLA